MTPESVELARARTNASRALVYSLVGLVFFGIFLGPTAIALARSANATFARHGHPPQRKATVGMWLGAVVTLLWLVFFGVRLSGIVR